MGFIRTLFRLTGWFALVIGGAVSFARQAPAPYLLGFSSDRGGSYDVYVLTTTKLRRLTESVHNEVISDWSPDGKTIGYTLYDGDNNHLALLNINTRQTRYLRTNWNDARSPTWSPDGTQVLFYAPRFRNMDLFVLQGEEVRQLTREIAFLYGATWSPQEDKIAFVYDNSPFKTSGNADIYVIGDDGTEMHALTDSAAHDLMPAWSPDGSRLLFASDRQGNLDIYVMNADGSQLEALFASEYDESQPAWSPDGRYIAFQSNRAGNPDIYVAEGAQMQQVTDHPSADCCPTWSPFINLRWRAGWLGLLGGALLAVSCIIKV